MPPMSVPEVIGPTGYPVGHDLMGRCLPDAHSAAVARVSRPSVHEPCPDLVGARS